MHAGRRFAMVLLALGSLAMLAPAGAQSAQHQAQMPMGGMGSQSMSKVTAPVAGPLTITYGDQSAEWTPARLAALRHTTVKVYNEHAKADETYSGVPLIDLLAKLGVPAKPRGKQFRLYLVAAGADGYEVVYSLGEVAPDVHDATVIVADRMNGEPIKESGPLKLVATGEKRPARWVRNLVAIHVRTAE